MVRAITFFGVSNVVIIPALAVTFAVLIAFAVGVQALAALRSSPQDRPGQRKANNDNQKQLRAGAR